MENLAEIQESLQGIMTISDLALLSIFIGKKVSQGARKKIEIQR